MDDAFVTILDGNTFVVSDARGDIEAGRAEPTGLFSFDTRFLSTWVLTIGGQRLTALSIDDLQYYETRFFLVPDTGTVYLNATLSVIRQRVVADGFQEHLTILNHETHAVDLTARIAVGSDFADLFEVKDRLTKKGRYYVRTGQGRLVLGYHRESAQRKPFYRETTVFSDRPAEIDDQGLTFAAHLEPHGEWVVDLRVVATSPEPFRRGQLRGDVRKGVREDLKKDLAGWLSSAPRLDCSWAPLKNTYRRSLVDLAALRFSPSIAEGKSLPAAGLPWFMTIFGRDSILTSLQALPFAPELAATTIRVLAKWQGTSTDDFRDEDPGRILHELRYGELTQFAERPHSPYFGSADATPLFVVLLDEYERWTGDVELVCRYHDAALAAVRWIDEYADLMGNGYLSYQTRNEQTGLANQGWKDSWDSICYRDGRLPGFPRATCELQGYAYDAKRRAARLARLCWNDHGLADRLERAAEDFKRRFNRDFWIADQGYYAVALDADGGQVDALTSNIGHLLWSGIVDDDKAPAVAEHLLGARLFSGWGVRTLAKEQRRYNPIGYHVGTVWPFDNSFIAWGLRNYRFKDQAARIADALLHAASFFNGRLPEAFAGYDQHVTKYPVRYPSACSPQAWSAGAPLLFLRTMLGLDPIGDHLLTDPAVPVGIGRIELANIPGRWGRVNAFARGTVKIKRKVPGPSEFGGEA